MLKIVSSIILVTFIWGYLWVTTKIGLEYMPPLLYSASRLLIGAFVLLVFQIIRKRDWFPNKEDWKKLIVMGILMCVGYNGLSVFGMQYVNSGLSSVLVYTMPIIVSVLAHFFLNERLNLNKVIGLIIGSIGLLFIIGPQIFKLELNSTILGEFLIILSAIFWASTNIFSKRVFVNYDTIKMTTWQLLIGGSILFVISTVYEPINATRWTTTLILSLLYNGIFGSAIAFVCWFWVIRKIDASIASITLMAVPILGLVFGWLQLGERITKNEIYGALFICIGIFLASAKIKMKSNKRPNEIEKVA